MFEGTCLLDQGYDECKARQANSGHNHAKGLLHSAVIVRRQLLSVHDLQHLHAHPRLSAATWM